MTPRQEQYRKRMLLKARYFDQHAERRKAELRVDMASTWGDLPEKASIAPYFLSHPRATWVPLIIHGVKVGWDVAAHREIDSDADFHLALTYVALRDTSSFPVHAQIITDSGTGVLDDSHPDVAQVRAEIAGLKDVGMWVTE